MQGFNRQLEQLSDEATQHPDRFGAGVRLLFSCGTRDMISALAQAGDLGLDARGVGRMHILIEYNDVVPDVAWTAREGAKIGQFFERVAARRPQIAIDRAAG